MPQEKEQISEQQQKLNDMITDYKRTFASEHGARVLENIGKFCHAKARTYTAGCRPEDSIFAQGQRDVFLHIEEMVNAKLDEKKPEQTDNKPVEK
jgi:hypothetical protein